MRNYLKTLQSFVAGFTLLLCAGAGAQAVALSAPVVLVATDRLAGSPYEQTVLLAVPSGDGEHLGLILNRPTGIDLSTVFPDATPSPTATGPVFFGGPEMSDEIFAAVRATDPPSQYSVSLLPGLFLVTDADTVDRLVTASPGVARYFAGFVVWQQGELAHEIQNGMWDVQSADTNVLFRENPQELWLDLARKSTRVSTDWRER